MCYFHRPCRTITTESLIKRLGIVEGGFLTVLRGVQSFCVLHWSCSSHSHFTIALTRSSWEGYRQGLDLCPRGYVRTTCFNNLGSFVGNRYARSGRMEDLEESIACHSQALSLRPRGHPDRSTSLSNFGGGLTSRFNQLERIEDLGKAVACPGPAIPWPSRSLMFSP